MVICVHVRDEDDPEPHQELFSFLQAEIDHHLHVCPFSAVQQNPKIVTVLRKSDVNR